ncbi:sulfotransferase domain-containing protein [Candidatus Kaiserbacteria bacterium]|nr:sulfotransferase domain-containing protein [Candidatus Kaiserbacteria bacterium]
MKRGWLKTLRKSVDMAYRTLIKRDTPVIVYSQGRVGSISMIRAIRRAGCLGYKVESFSKERLASVKFCKRFVIDAGREAKIVALVRDPIAILISLYFSKLKHLPPVENDSLEALEQHFITHMLDHDKYHDQYLRWFLNEFEPNLGFSVYDYPFDAEAKYAVIKHQRFPTLIMRSVALDDDTKSTLVSDFLGTPVKIKKSNMKTKDPQYVRFKESVKLPKDIVEDIYNLPYTQHFFTPQERTEMIARWTRQETTA